MSAAAPAKFTFDLDLARVRTRTRTLPEDELEAMLEEARRSGYEQGFAAGEAGAAARSADALAGAATTLADNAAQMVEALDRRQKENLREAVTLAASIARKLAAHLIARQPHAELTALIQECLGALEHAPHLVVRCHPELSDAIRSAAEDRIRASGFSGRLVVMGDPDIKLGDGRIEWADGGLVRDMNAISNDINTRISAYLSARGAKENKGD
ncbi:flagellar assembly protein FliH [Pelagibacterium halotolerans]|uniref:flagellar assembly protein FliH n=1 Tax=Pelagibacterium halotolerans TaxID=531813 RepID=UPI00384FDD0B